MPLGTHSALTRAKKDKSQESILPKLEIGMKLQMLLRDEGTRQVALLNKSEQLCKWRGKGMTLRCWRRSHLHCDPLLAVVGCCPLHHFHLPLHRFLGMGGGGR